jgi:hypothetical protein
MSTFDFLTSQSVQINLLWIFTGVLLTCVTYWREKFFNIEFEYQKLERALERLIEKRREEEEEEQEDEEEEEEEVTKDTKDTQTPEEIQTEVEQKEE